MRPIRVLVVDGSAVARRLITETLGVDPAIDVVGTAATGHLALSKSTSLRPDVVTLHGGLQGDDALQVLRSLKSAHPEVVVVVVTAPTPAGAALALACLDAGADDHIVEPEAAGGVVAAQRMLLTQLLPRVKELARAKRHLPLHPTRPHPDQRRSAVPPVSPELADVLAASGVRLTARPPASERPARPRALPYSVLVIGASTGGPDALAAVFRGLDPALRLPVLVVQHMPANFTALLARRLDGLSSRQVSEAVDGQPVRENQALVAPGGKHLELHREGARLIARLSEAPRENFVRPSVDVLFRTAARACGSGVLAVVLTGMGRDGGAGAREVRDAGGTVIVQDRPTSVVWGMPGVVAEEGLADEVLPIDAIGPALTARIRAVSRGVSSAG